MKIADIKRVLGIDDTEDPSLNEVREVVRKLQLQEYLQWPNTAFWDEWDGLLDLLGMERMEAKRLD